MAGQASLSIVPSTGQIVRRAMGLLRAIDLVHGFRVYTTLAVLVDLLWHGTQYLALAPLLHELLWSRKHHAALLTVLREHGGLAMAGLVAFCGLVATVAGQALLARLLRGRRLSVATLLRIGGGTRETPAALAALALVFVLVAAADVSVLSAHLNVTWLRKAAHRQPLAAGEALDPSLLAAASCSRVVLCVVCQGLLRAALVLALWWAHQRRSAKVLP
mmetsp:Transcript_45488/g.134639  ORF Transcript_45488/g.134639 Transcript_45488/m.134639 type:complete len:218 (+) Transcript_45488:133-786(+)